MAGALFGAEHGVAASDYHTHYSNWWLVSMVVASGLGYLRRRRMSTPRGLGLAAGPHGNITQIYYEAQPVDIDGWV